MDTLEEQEFMIHYKPKSGQFTSTMKTSRSVNSIEDKITDIEDTERYLLFVSIITRRLNKSFLINFARI